MTALPLLLLVGVQSVATTPDAPPAREASSPATDAAKADDALLVEPMRLLKAGNVDAALPLLDAAIARFEARYGAGTRWYAARDPAESLAYLAMAAADADEGKPGPKNARILPSDAWPLALYLKGYALIEVKRYDDAHAALERAVALSPFNAGYLTELAQAKRYREDWPGMLATAGRAAEGLAFSPKDEQAPMRARVLRIEGYALTELGRLDEAEAKYRAALAINPDDRLAANEIEYIRRLRREKQ